MNLSDEDLEIIGNIADRVGSVIANAISPLNTSRGTDAAGGSVNSLTEAVMGITNGLCKVADSISDLADAVRSHE